MNATKAPLLVHFTWKVKPEDKDKALEALRAVWDKFTTEPKCLYLNVFQSSLDPGRIRIVEMWDGDESWLRSEMPKRNWYQPFLDAVKPLLISQEWDTFSGIEGMKYTKTS